jgi:hypothetical protein
MYLRVLPLVLGGKYVVIPCSHHSRQTAGFSNRGVILAALLAGVLATMPSRPVISAEPAEQTAAVFSDPKHGFMLGRVYFPDRRALNELAAQFDLWEVNYAEGQVLAALDWSEYARLLSLG